ncbi:hypothetical protein BOX15_Mlig014598g1, partial [Macrostomum lignano]
LCAQLQRAQEELQQTQNENLDLQARESALLDSVSTLTKERDDTATECNLVASEAAQLKEANSDLNNRLEEVCAERDRMKEKCARLVKQCRILKEASKQSQQRAESADMCCQTDETTESEAAAGTASASVSDAATETDVVISSESSFEPGRLMVDACTDAEPSGIESRVSEQEVEQLLSSKMSLTEEVFELKQQLAALESSKQAVDSELDKAMTVMSAHDKLVSEHEVLISQRDSLVSERDALVTEREAMLSDYGSLSSERDALMKERETLMSERNDFASERDSMATEREALASENAQLMESATQLKEKHDSVCTERDRMKEKCARLVKQCRILKEASKQSHQQTETADMCCQTEAATESVAAAGTSSASVSDAATETVMIISSESSFEPERMMVDACTDAEPCELESRVSEQEVEHLLLSKMSLTEEVFDLKQQLAALETSKQTADSELERAISLMSERDSLASQCDSVILERDALISERERLIADLESLVSSRDALLSERDSLVTERDTLVSERASLVTELDSVTTERETLASENAQIMESAAQLREKHDSVCTERDRMKEKCARLVKQCRNLKEASKQSQHRAETAEFSSQTEPDTVSLAAAGAVLISDGGPMPSVTQINVSTETDLLLQPERPLVDVATDDEWTGALTKSSKRESESLLASKISLGEEVSELKNQLTESEAARKLAESQLEKSLQKLQIVENLAQHVSSGETQIEEFPELETVVSSVRVALLNTHSARSLQQSEIEQLQSTLKGLENIRDSLTGERDALASELQAMASQLEDIATERDSLKMDRSLLSSERDTLASEKVQLMESTSQMKEQHDAVCAERDRMKEKCARLVKQCRILKEASKQSQQRAETADICCQIDATTESVAAAGTESASVSDAATETDVISSDSLFEPVRVMVDASTDVEFNEVHSRVSEQEVEQLLFSKMALTEEVFELKQQLAASEASREATDSELAKVKVLNSDREDSVLDRDTLVLERDSLLTQRDNILLERDTLIVERESMLSDRENLVAERDALASENAALMESSTQLKVTHEEVSTERDRMKEKCARLVKQCRILKEAARQSQQRAETAECSCQTEPERESATLSDATTASNARPDVSVADASTETVALLPPEASFEKENPTISESQTIEVFYRAFDDAIRAAGLSYREVCLPSPPSLLSMSELSEWITNLVSCVASQHQQLVNTGERCEGLEQTIAEKEESLTEMMERLEIANKRAITTGSASWISSRPATSVASRQVECDLTQPLIDELEATLAKRDGKIAAMERDSRELNRKLESHLQTMRRMEARLQASSRMLRTRLVDSAEAEQLAVEVESLFAQLDAAEEEVGQLRLTLRDRDNELLRLADQLRVESEAKRLDLSTMREQSRLYEAEVRRLRFELDAKEEMLTLTREAATPAAAASTSSGCGGEDTAGDGELDNSAAFYKRRTDELTVELNNARNSIQRLTGELKENSIAAEAAVEKLRAELSVTVESKELLNRELIEAKTACDSLTVEIAEAKEDGSIIEKLNSELATASDDKELLNKELFEAKATIDNLTAELAKTKTEIELVGDSNSKLTNAIRDKELLSEELSKAKATIDNLTAELAKTKTELELVGDSNSKLTNAIRDKELLSEELSKAKATIDNLTAELAKTKTKVDGDASEALGNLNSELTVALEEKEKELSETKVLIDNLTAELTKAKEDMVIESTETRSIIEQLAKDKENLNQQLTAANNGIDSLNIEFVRTKEDLNNRLAEAECTIDNLRSELASAATANDNLCNELAEAKILIDELRNEQKEVEKPTLATVSCASQTEAVPEAAGLEQQRLYGAGQDTADGESEASLRSRLAEKERLEQRYAALVKKLRQQRQETLQQHRSQLAEVQSAAAAEVDELRRRLEASEAELDSARMSLALAPPPPPPPPPPPQQQAAESELQSLRAVHSRCQGQLDQVRAERNRIQQEFDRLRRRLEERPLSSTPPPPPSQPIERLQQSSSPTPSPPPLHAPTAEASAVDAAAAAAAEDEVLTLRSENEGLRFKVSVLETKAKKMEFRLRAERDKIDKLQLRLDEKDVELDQLVDKLRASRGQLESERSRHLNEAKRLSAALEAEEARAGKLERRLRDGSSESATAALAEEAAAAREAKRQSEQRLLAEAADLRGQLDELAADNRDLRSRLEAAAPSGSGASAGVSASDCAECRRLREAVRVLELQQASRRSRQPTCETKSVGTEAVSVDEAACQTLEPDEENDAMQRRLNELELAAVECESLRALVKQMEESAAPCAPTPTPQPLRPSPSPPPPDSEDTLSASQSALDESSVLIPMLMDEQQALAGLQSTTTPTMALVRRLRRCLQPWRSLRLRPSARNAVIAYLFGLHCLLLYWLLL